MANWVTMSVSSAYAALVQLINDKFIDLAKGNDPAKVTITNPPTDMLRWSSAVGRWEKYDGTSWVELASTWRFSSNIEFSGTTGQRLRGDFSSWPPANRVMFQSSVPNGNTGIYALPNGTATNAAWTVVGSSDTANFSYGQLGIDGAAGLVRLASGGVGSGASLPIGVQIGGNEVARFETDGRFRAKSYSAFDAVKTSAYQDVATGSSTISFNQAAGSNDYSTSSNTYTAPRNGWYRFDVTVDANAHIGTPGSVGLETRVDGVMRGYTRKTIASTESFSLVHSRTLYLLAGQAVTVVLTVSNVGAVVRVLNSFGTTFSGAYVGD